MPHFLLLVCLFNSHVSFYFLRDGAGLFLLLNYNLVHSLSLSSANLQPTDRHRPERFVLNRLRRIRFRRREFIRLSLYVGQICVEKSHISLQNAQNRRNNVNVFSDALLLRSDAVILYSEGRDFRPTRSSLAPMRIATAPTRLAFPPIRIAFAPRSSPFDRRAPPRLRRAPPSLRCAPPLERNPASEKIWAISEKILPVSDKNRAASDKRKGVSARSFIESE